MTSFFPDLNVWLALSDDRHGHAEIAWRWKAPLSSQSRLIFSRYTQLGLLRLLTNPSVMLSRTLTMREAWRIYDRWLDDPLVEFHPEPSGVEETLRHTTVLNGKAASKWLGDCYLLAHASRTGASLVTFDRALVRFARRHGYSAIIPD